VIGFDVAKPKNPPVAMAESAQEAVAQADVVFSLNSSTVALRVAEGVAGSLKPGAIYADLNTGTPSLKRNLAAALPDGCFVDVAVMKPVPGLAEKVPCGIAGPAAKRFEKLMAPLGMDLEYVSEQPGDAAARKLIRSIVAKGMAALIIDTLWAAKSMGMEDWAIAEIKNEFDTSSSATVQRYLDGTAKHAKRRSVEMTDVVEMLADSKYDSTMVNGVSLTLSHVMHGRKIPFAKPTDD
jgi:3-hydroxyisobutyrate dehydrogenase-like beta-hydroxyacid dehydrogenase